MMRSPKLKVVQRLRMGQEEVDRRQIQGQGCSGAAQMHLLGLEAGLKVLKLPMLMGYSDRVVRKLIDRKLTGQMQVGQMQIDQKLKW